MLPTIKFESLNPGLASNTNSVVTRNGGNSDNKRRNNCCFWRICCQEIFDILVMLYRIMAFPVKILMQITIPGSEPHDKCECLYPLAFILSMIWITGFALVLVVITYHWSELFEWKLSIMGIVYIGPIATLPNVVDCVKLSLQGYAAEIITNSYHIQISNIFLGITVPLIISSLPMINAIDPFHHC